MGRIVGGGDVGETEVSYLYKKYKIHHSNLPSVEREKTPKMLSQYMVLSHVTLYTAFLYKEQC